MRPQLLACAVLLRLHPLPLIYTPSYEFSVSFAGVAFGTATGLRRAKHLHVAGALLPILWREGGAIAVVRRLALGAAATSDTHSSAVSDAASDSWFVSASVCRRCRACSQPLVSRQRAYILWLEPPSAGSCQFTAGRGSVVCCVPKLLRGCTLRVMTTARL